MEERVNSLLLDAICQHFTTTDASVKRMACSTYGITMPPGTELNAAEDTLQALMDIEPDKNDVDSGQKATPNHNTDADGFRVPRKSVKRKLLPSPNKVTETPSKYAALDVDANDEDAAQPLTNPTQTKRPSIPPVILRDKNSWTNISAKLRSEKIEFSKAKNLTDAIRIHPMTANDYRRMTKLFDEQKIAYHTYSLPEQKLLKVVFRGVCEAIPDAEVKADLEAQGLHPIDVHRLRKRNANKTPMPLVMANLPRDEKHVYKITRLCGLSITVEAMNKKLGPSQCHRCQKFGHSQACCRAVARCVKCAQTHLTKDCTKSRDIPAKCCNCQGAHPANYKGCPAYPQETRPATTTTSNQQRKPAKTGKTPGKAPEVRRPASYARAVDPRPSAAAKASATATQARNAQSTEPPTAGNAPARPGPTPSKAARANHRSTATTQAPTRESGTFDMTSLLELLSSINLDKLQTAIAKLQASLQNAKDPFTLITALVSCLPDILAVFKK